MNRRLAAMTALLVVMGAGLATGCSTTSPTADSSPPTVKATPPTSTDPATTIEVRADSDALQHIHNLGLSGETLLLGSHQGLFSQPVGQPPRRVSEPFDVMGFAIDEDRWLASGHPGAGMNAPADLGLLESQDQGESWTDVSLAGQVDFHRLTASQDTVLGVNSGDGLLWRSVDAGTSWDTLGPGPFDVALNPQNPRRAVGTTQDGPIASTNGGRDWAPIPGAPVIALLAWTSDRLWGVTPDGAVHSSVDNGETWRRAGTVAGSATAVAANPKRVVILAGDTIWESLDQGATFAPRVTDLPGH